MSEGIEFEEDSRYGHAPGRPAGTPFQQAAGAVPGGEGAGMAGWLRRHGMAKSANGALVMMISIVVVNIILILLVWKLFL